MEREIKFRGKKADGSAWVYGDLRQENSGRKVIMTNLSTWRDNPDDIETYGENVIVNPDTIGQYTGWRDNKTQMREVYEHDLYEVNGVLCEVVYNQQIASFVLLEIITQQIGTRPIGEMLDMFPYMYKGNIYDNPELLED